MKKAILLYSSREGQTTKILQFIATKMAGYQCELLDLHDIDSNIAWANYDKIMVAASIRYGKFNPKLYHFIEQHHNVLSERRAVFVCVNLTARKEEEGKDTPEGSAYVQTFLKRSQWQPQSIGVFAGALQYPKYRWFDRIMIRFIMSMTGGETDTSKPFVEYTNWNKVEKFALSFAQD